jgi:hypothetical protein
MNERITEKIAELLGPGPIGVLAPVERRLVDISSQLWPNIIFQLRYDTSLGQLLPISDEMASRSARLAVIAAIEMDDQLRKVRDGLAAARTPK